MNKEMLNRIARYCATSGAQNTTDGRWSITYDELSHHFCVNKNDINGNAQLLADALNQQEEINDLMMTEDCIEMTYHIEHCPLCQQGGIEGAFALSSVLGCNITDEHEEHKYEPMPYDEVETKLARQILWLYAGEGEQQCFSRCEITGQSFIARDFPNLSFYNCRFNNVDFSEADLSYCTFENCDFVDCDLSYVKAEGAVLVISILLILFGAVLIRRGRTNEDIPERVDDSFTVKKVIVRSLITNLDAVLVSFCVALRNVPFFEALIIGVIANFLASFAGLEIGYRHGYVMRKIPMVSGILMLIFGVYFAVLSV